MSPSLRFFFRGLRVPPVEAADLLAVFAIAAALLLLLLLLEDEAAETGIVKHNSMLMIVVTIAVNSESQHGNTWSHD